MQRTLTSQEMRDMERAAEAVGMLPSVLMENAGAALAEAALRLASLEGRFCVLCGGGNNGGDGLVAARKLASLGRSVLVEVVEDAARLQGDAKRNFQALRAIGLSPGNVPANFGFGSGDVIIDALLGTGLNRAPAGEYADAIGRIGTWRGMGARVLSADLPSGLHSDTGEVFVPCVRADVTLSFGQIKVGQVLDPGASRCGELRRVDIGIPPVAGSQALKWPSVFLLEESDVSRRLPERRPDTHKGSFGHVLAVAGSWGKTGAAALAGMGALRSGAGLVTVATRPEALVPVLAHAPELMGVELVSEGGLGLSDLNSLLEAADGKQVVLIGPGMPRGPETAKLLGALLEELTIPCVIDADGLNALAEDPKLLHRAKGPVLITPHPGEMARLLGKSVKEIQKNRVEAVRTLSNAHHLVTVLKGARTLTCIEDGSVFVNPTGNPGMATGGTGDVLSGVCAALLAQGLSVEDAAVVGVFAHGLAGDLMVEQTGQLGLMASDLLEGLQRVWTRWSR